MKYWPVRQVFWVLQCWWYRRPPLWDHPHACTSSFCSFLHSVNGPFSKSHLSVKNQFQSVHQLLCSIIAILISPVHNRGGAWRVKEVAKPVRVHFDLVFVENNHAEHKPSVIDELNHLQYLSWMGGITYSISHLARTYKVHVQRSPGFVGFFVFAQTSEPVGIS